MNYEKYLNKKKKTRKENRNLAQWLRTTWRCVVKWPNRQQNKGNYFVSCLMYANKPIGSLSYMRTILSAAKQNNHFGISTLINLFVNLESHALYLLNNFQIPTSKMQTISCFLEALKHCTSVKYASLYSIEVFHSNEIWHWWTFGWDLSINLPLWWKQHKQTNKKILLQIDWILFFGESKHHHIW